MMVAHVVLYRPRPDASAAELSRLADAISRAPRDIPLVKRCWIGRSLPDPPPYRMSGFPAFPFCAVLEFEDRAALEAYLGHAAHEELGRLFNETTEAALIYDFVVTESVQAAALLGDLLPP